jgi:flagellar biosynthesis protein FliR
MLFLITLPAISKKNMPISTIGVLLSIPLAYLAYQNVKKLPASTLLLIAFELGIIGMYLEMIWKIRWKSSTYK